ncbi:MAG TPA: xanthine dehydrogenase family protein molybdopterin-binding subunit [Candidatus Dormibacteraeota bacterium]|jgi:CO/xanthine dehydrogenase Mo-binding subunit|nr:xanthine dehydrogenase family protein molybdopterin-binding subunit [Candidatus Dormibacteraeota bacterium]
MAVIGVAQRRLEGGAKVTGAERFTADLRLVDLAHARLVLSPHAAARVRRVDLEAARRAPGVLVAVSGLDLPDLGLAGPEQPLARERVFYAGQPVAAVVAETEAQAADAAALVGVDYEPLPALIDPMEAMWEGAPRVLEEVGGGPEDAGAHGLTAAGEVAEDRPPNVTAQVRFRRGEVEPALARCRAVVRRRYVLPAVHQGFMEPHVAVARPEPDGGLTIWTPTQGAFLTRRTVADQLRMPVSRVRVIPMAVGGGFGGKVCLLEPLVALLARLTGIPVRLELSRSEEFAMGRGGPGCVVDLELGADGDGDLVALRARAVFDAGAGSSGLGGLAGIMLGGTYRIPNYEITALDVATNKTPVTAYRAPGAPQAFFALESAMDELAAELGLDPIAFRLRNASREGDPRPDGQPWPRIGLMECLEAARRHPLYTAPRAEGEGVGVAVGGWGGGREPAAAGCRVEPDGSLLVQVGSVDITGTDTGLAMIAAETFGLPLDRVRVERGDTATAPYAGMAGGSKIIYTVGPAVQQAAAEARRQLLEIAAEELEAAVEDLEIRDGRVQVQGAPGRGREIGELAELGAQFMGRYAPVQGQGRAVVTAQSPMFTVHLARVRVDRDTGEWRLLGYAAIQDVGRALNPPEVEGQVHGGTVQGLGRALGEGLVWDREGQLLTTSFVDYGLPSIDQVPDIQVELVEVPSPHGPFGAKGVGEPPAVPGPAAIANAVAAACGRRISELPVEFEVLARSGT